MTSALLSIIVGLLLLNVFQSGLLGLLIVWPQKIEPVRKLLARITQ